MAWSWYCRFARALIQILLACLLVWALVAPQWSATSRFFRARWLMFLGTYSYGLYVYHHFISHYLTVNRTELELAQWLGARMGRRWRCRRRWARPPRWHSPT